jgi:long-chain acyl-CoA synthetase
MYLTLTQQLQQLAQESPDRVVILYRQDDSVQEYTYAQIFEACRRVACGLMKLGVRKGDRVAIMLENRPEWPICYFGLLLAGAVAVPLDLQFRAGQIEYMLNQTQARVLFASGALPQGKLPDLPFMDKIVRLGPGPPLKKGLDFTELMREPAAPCSFPSLRPEDLASIIYTSGTTGPPKGVMLTHKNFFANFLGIKLLGAVKPEDNFLSLLPLFHSFPFMATLIVPLFTRSRITYLNTLKPDQVLRCVREQKVTIFAVTPQLLEHFSQGIAKRLAALPLGLGTAMKGITDVGWKIQSFLGLNPVGPFLRRMRDSLLGPQFRFFISGGAKLPADLQIDLSRLGFEVREGYGLTETSPVVSLNPPEAPKIGSAGKPLPGVEIMVRHPGPDGVGQILIRGDNVTPGYYQDEARTGEVLRDGWLDSGDLGYQDRDGYLFVTGRLKDIIVLRSGKKISSEEVARHYLQAKSIKEIYVMPDSREKQLVAVVVPDFGYFRALGETEVYEEVKWDIEYYSQLLEPYKRVRDFVLVNQELPKTRLGKVKHQEAEDLYRERAGRRPGKKRLAREEELSEVGEVLVDLLTQKVGSNLISLDDHLELDLHFDSLAMVQLAVALEERFGIVIREEEFSEIFTVADLIGFVEGKHPAIIQALEEQGGSWRQLLQAEPPLPRLSRISQASGIAGRLLTLGCSLLLGAAFKLFFNLKVYGALDLKPAGYILCPNHASFLDGFLMFQAVPSHLRHRLFFLGSSRHFDRPLARDFARLMRIIPVDTARHLVEAMQAAAVILRQGGIMCIFPEGVRSLNGQLGTFKKGVGILAGELQVKLVPVFIQGSFEAWPAHADYPRPHPIQIMFGQEFSAEELLAQGQTKNPGAQDYEAISLGLKEQVMKLGRELESKTLSCRCPDHA